MAANRTAKSIATRQRFVDEALRLFKERGYESTSMAQIAAAAGSSRANLYLYFNSKSQIIRARMTEIETEVAELYEALDGMPQHTPGALREWLETARGMWLRYATEFEAVNQAMTIDPDVLEEWLGLIRRVSSAHAALHLGGATEEERTEREAHMATLMMGLERTFYFLYIRGHKEREELILASLARQWARLFDD
ncbi:MULTISPECIES: TetR/AcrR family transcriptional regulator [unclassified Streptomyces]|uniref:TetR/AcrR family transcriptional regulator n=1 Tax=unclassified Streptomyces TaxID=2593676 RepID=UPI0007ED4687|nr:MULTISPECIES: TetR/AcrR family transcriptional regulator [unclassified Streptomyces]MCP3768092.1 TetR/AcrR family transcriptional regulator [Streptomyces sp. MAR25Y5]OBQ46765.1 TetR family transcriptional regulator [Streptomyces sp. H-KF8]